MFHEETKSNQSIDKKIVNGVYFIKLTQLLIIMYHFLFAPSLFARAFAHFEVFRPIEADLETIVTHTISLSFVRCALFISIHFVR